MGHGHQISKTNRFTLEKSLLPQFLEVWPMLDPWHEPTNLLEKKTFIVEIALT